MKKLLLAAVLAFVVNVIDAQCDSSVIVATGTAIKDLTILQDHSIVAVTNSGTIIKSTDAGNKWRNIVVPQNGGYWAVDFPSSSVGYATGNGGVLKSEDKGETWFPIFSENNGNSALPAFSQYFFDSDHGLIGGQNGHLLTTKNGGRTFKDTTITTADILSIDFTDDQNGIAAGRNFMAKTNDGGFTWTPVDVSHIAYSVVIHKVKYLSSSVLVAVGQDGLFMKSTDGGVTWTKYATPSGVSYYDFHFFDSNNGILAGDVGGGQKITTNDGGITFAADFDFPLQARSIYALAMDPQTDRLYLGGGGISGSVYGGRVIIATEDKGSTWTGLSLNGVDNYGNLQVLDDSTLIIGTGSSMLISRDSGESFLPMPAVTELNGLPAGAWMYNFVNKNEGFALITDLYKTIDGGNTWEVRGRPLPRQYGFYGRIQLQFLDTTHGVLSDMYSINKTIDGGYTWTLATIPANNGFFTDCAFTPSGNGFAVGYGGDVQVSIDKGTSWQPYNLGTDEYLKSVYFYNDQLGFIGTSDSAIYKTVDGGASWSKINTGTHYLPISSFLFMNVDHGYLIAGENGNPQQILETKDGGQTWRMIWSESGIYSKLQGKNSLYYTGSNGLIGKSIKLQKPGFPGYISGKEAACIGDNVVYTLPAMYNVNYHWSLSSGGQQQSGQFSDTVIWSNSGKHTLSVAISNVCGVGPASTIEVTVSDFTPTITDNLGTLELSKGTYYWWYQNNVLISHGAADSLSKLVPENSGLYHAAVSNELGCVRLTDTISYTKPLPLEILRFSGSLLSNHVIQLAVETAWEKYAKHIILERSIDSTSFSPTDSVAARNNYSNGESYTLTDTKATKGMNFYRIRVTQHNRTSIYSAIIGIRGSDSDEPLIYPNPASNVLHISRGNENITAVTITNYQGSVVYRQQYPASPGVTINISPLQSGLYIVKIQTEHSEYNIQLMIIK